MVVIGMVPFCLFTSGLISYFCLVSFLKWISEVELDADGIFCISMTIIASFILLVCGFVIIKAHTRKNPSGSEFIEMHGGAIEINLTDWNDNNMDFDVMKYEIRQKGVWAVKWNYKPEGKNTIEEIRYHDITDGENHTFRERLVEGQGDGRPWVDFQNFRFIEVDWNGNLERKYVK